jgi:outer membrane protein OmpA-like peptidoglycan-associated protein
MRSLGLLTLPALVACATGGPAATGTTGAAGSVSAADEARARSSDVDGDGIRDREDKCPTDPETPNGYMDDDGCPDLASAPVTRGGGPPEIVEKIAFADGRSDIRPGSFPVLDAIALVLKMQPELFPVVALEGHAATNETGPMKLSLARASAVRMALIARGVPQDRLLAQVSGSTDPVCVDDNERCWARQRRVEFLTLSSSKRPDVAAGREEVESDADPDRDKAAEKPAASARPAPVALDSVTFASGSVALAPASLPTLDLLAGFLKANPVSLEIEGHADDNERKAAELARARANAVRAYMIACGVSAESLIVRVQGTARPACTGRGSACRARNRRVELRFPETTPAN